MITWWITQKNTDMAYLSQFIQSDTINITMMYASNGYGIFINFSSIIHFNLNVQCTNT